MENKETGGRNGFIFAFFKYSGIWRSASIIQHVVHYLLASDIIHVAMIPVFNYEMVPLKKKTGAACTGSNSRSYADETKDCSITSAYVASSAFTAFWGIGVNEPETASILNKNYDYYFMPVHDNTKFREGLKFLVGLRGVKYNYFDLPLTLMPERYKHLTKGALLLDHTSDDECESDKEDHASSKLSFFTTEKMQHGKFEHGILSHYKTQPHSSDATQKQQWLQQLHRNQQLKHLLYHQQQQQQLQQQQRQSRSNKRIFCSQMGLLLCYVCDILPNCDMDPSSCSPYDLLQIISKNKQCVPCCKRSINIIQKTG